MASRSWNRVELIGNITRDPELRYTPSGAAVCTFGIATNRTYVSGGEKKEDVDFHRVVAWNKLAELCSQLLKKGAKVFISGRLQYNEWETQDGQKRKDAEINLEDMLLITPRSGQSFEEAPVETEEPSSSGVEVKPAVKEVEPAKKEEAPVAEADQSAQPTEKATESVADDDLPF